MKKLSKNIVTLLSATAVCAVLSACSLPTVTLGEEGPDTKAHKVYSCAADGTVRHHGTAHIGGSGMDTGKVTSMGMHVTTGTPSCE